MDQIKVIRLTSDDAIQEIEQTAVFAARLTQRGHKLNNADDVIALFEKDYTPQLVCDFMDMPHPTLQKFGVVNYVIVGASRRFLAQVTRHQNEVKFMSASLQYSDYSDNNQFCVPYELIKADAERIGNAQYADNYHKTQYLNSCMAAMADYRRAREQGVDNDTCGYMAPQGLRNILLISATPYQWKHMIRQRVCRRNTDETRYVFLRIWEDLYSLSGGAGARLWGLKQTRPQCCLEGKMSCRWPIEEATPQDMLRHDFPLLCKEVNDADTDA